MNLARALRSAGFSSPVFGFSSWCLGECEDSLDSCPRRVVGGAGGFCLNILEIHRPCRRLALRVSEAGEAGNERIKIAFLSRHGRGWAGAGSRGVYVLATQTPADHRVHRSRTIHGRLVRHREYPDFL